MRCSAYHCSGNQGTVSTGCRRGCSLWGMDRCGWESRSSPRRWWIPGRAGSPGRYCGYCQVCRPPGSPAGL